MVLGRFFLEIVGRECQRDKYQVIDHARKYQEVNIKEIKVLGK
ncbi:43620_t:CDS:2 [Gigaspora margarita]|uniref:43620_t:CDS:1 n=1 Tax=Gigaspora margarita TaxID=4874 RepID=A0ABN7UF15_GIGMA|nr:43620_t:CDS:2 [Gigaspora margarita]